MSAADAPPPDPPPDPPSPDLSSSEDEAAVPRRIYVVGAALLRGGKVMAARRAPHVSAAGKWEFPGGKVEAGESPQQALCRELAEELSLELAPGAIGEKIGRGLDEHPARVIVLDVYAVESPTWYLDRLVDHDRTLWLDAASLHSVRWAKADRPILPKLEARLRSG